MIEEEETTAGRGVATVEEVANAVEDRGSLL